MQFRMQFIYYAVFDYEVYIRLYSKGVPTQETIQFRTEPER